MKNNLCCLLNTVWICRNCGWRICRDHWTGDARFIHREHRAEGCLAHNIEYVDELHWGQVMTARLQSGAIKMDIKFICDVRGHSLRNCHARCLKHPGLLSGAAMYRCGRCREYLCTVCHKLFGSRHWGTGYSSSKDSEIENASKKK